MVAVPFEKILPFWQNELWPNRKSPIEQTSFMKFLGGYHVPNEIGDPVFWQIQNVEHEVLGVISCHALLSSQFRLRGIFVRQGFRGAGHGSALIQHVVDHCRSLIHPKGLSKSGVEQPFLWALPRVSSIKLFSRNGFTQESEPISDGMEFGPNYYARFIL